MSQSRNLPFRGVSRRGIYRGRRILGSLQPAEDLTLASRREDLTLASGMVLAWRGYSFSGELPEADLNERYSASPTLVYEKWQLDAGGTSGLDCQVFRIRTLGLVARYRQIDPDHGDRSPISGGCGH